MHKALFLDRDGVINLDHGYVHRIQDFRFAPGIFDLCMRFQRQGYKLVVVTNQAGIGYGLYDEAQFHRLSQWMLDQFAQRGVDIAGVYFCPHHPEKAKGRYLQSCACRKPQPGMLLQAAEELKLDLSRSVIIGDKLSDIQAGQRAELARCVLLASNYVDDQQARSEACERVAGLDEIQP